MFNPAYHPNGNNIVLTLTENDTDIFTHDKSGKALASVIDSTGEDRLARFSPVNNTIAFVSLRSGKQQVFLKKEQEEIRVYENSENLPIYSSPIWSNSGDKIAFAFAQRLFIYTLSDKSLNEITMPESFTAVLDLSLIHI